MPTFAIISRRDYMDAWCGHGDVLGIDTASKYGHFSIKTRVCDTIQSGTHRESRGKPLPCPSWNILTILSVSLCKADPALCVKKSAKTIHVFCHPGNYFKCQICTVNVRCCINEKSLCIAGGLVT